MVVFLFQLALGIVALVISKLLVLGLLDGAPVRTLVLPLGIDGAVQSVAVGVDCVAVFAGEELANVGSCCLRRHGHVDARDLEIGVGRWWTVPLHVVEPRGWHVLLDAQCCSQRWAQVARLEVFHTDFVLLALEVYVTMRSLLGFLLVLEESIVQDLVVNLDLAHLRLHAFSHLLLQCLGIVCLARLLPKLADARLLNEVWQLEGYLVDATLVLQIAALLRPVSWDRHRVPDLLAFEQEEWVFGRDVPGFNQVWPPHLHLKVEDFHLSELLTLLLGHLSFGRRLLLPARVHHGVSTRHHTCLLTLLSALASFTCFLADCSHRHIHALLLQLRSRLLVEPLKDLHEFSVRLV